MNPFQVTIDNLGDISWNIVQLFFVVFLTNIFRYFKYNFSLRAWKIIANLVDTWTPKNKQNRE